MDIRKEIFTIIDEELEQTYMKKVTDKFALEKPRHEQPFHSDKILF